MRAWALGLLWIGARGLAGPRPALVFVAMAGLRAGLILGAVAAWVVWGGAWAALVWLRDALGWPPEREGPLVEISPDAWVSLEWRGWQITATVAYTWLVMAVLVLGSRAMTARLVEGERVSRWQMLLEAVVSQIRDQIEQVGTDGPERYLPFIGTLLLFIATAKIADNRLAGQCPVWGEGVDLQPFRPILSRDRLRRAGFHNALRRCD